ncbi:hypothetical protein Msub_12711 [Marinobacter subterrani]|uniref:Uncharacterized protein n=1 Tax=Marinobacter subterrani TaxID=1658765 RepID=A0A0J7JED5_9GAMM|nr:hypothetical protein Msub_12711 [Marinobacter subterrani]
MGGKPDIIRAIMLIFAIGLVITGFTSIRAPDDQAASNNAVVGSAQVANQPLNR